MLSRSRVLVAVSLVLFIGAGSLGCGFRRGNRVDKSQAQLANIYGTWVARQGGGYTVVLLADTDSSVENSRLIGRIPGQASGTVMVRESSKSKWLMGIYKVVGDKILARSSTEETWALTLRCDLKRGKLFLPSGDGKDVELYRSSETGIKTPAGKDASGGVGPALRPPGF